MTASTGRRAAQWRKKAHPIWRAPSTVACRGEDPGLFYKGEQERQEDRVAREEKAKGLCQVCHARTECLEAAMEEERSGGRFGIRGGYTPEERKNLQVSRTLKARNARKEAEREAGEAA